MAIMPNYIYIKAPEKRHDPKLLHQMKTDLLDMISKDEVHYFPRLTMDNHKILMDNIVEENDDIDPMLQDGDPRWT